MTTIALPPSASGSGWRVLGYVGAPGPGSCVHDVRTGEDVDADLSAYDGHQATPVSMFVLVDFHDLTHHDDLRPRIEQPAAEPVPAFVHPHLVETPTLDAPAFIEPGPVDARLRQLQDVLNEFGRRLRSVESGIEALADDDDQADDEVSSTFVREVHNRTVEAMRLARSIGERLDAMEGVAAELAGVNGKAGLVCNWDFDALVRRVEAIETTLRMRL